MDRNGIKPTIQDVALLAQVSTATVSRALSGSKPVSDAVQQKVESAARALGYRTNSIARALRMDRTGTIGMLIPDITNPFFTDLVASVEAELQTTGTQLLLCSSRGDVAGEAARLRLLESNRVDAILVTPSHEFLSLPALLEVSKTTPIVQIDQRVRGLEAPWVGLDEEHAAGLLIGHLADRDVRVAAYVGGTTEDSSARARLAAIRAQCERFGILLPSGSVFLETVTESWGRQAAHSLLQSTLPDVVICGADVIAYGLLQVFDEENVNVPRDVLVTGFDDVPYSSHSRIALTTIRQPIQAIAAAAIEQVNGRLAGDRQPHEMALKASLVERRSTNRNAP